MNKITCNNCGAEVNAEFKYCPKCNTLLKKILACQKNNTLIIVACVIGFCILYIILAILFGEGTTTSSDYQNLDVETKTEEQVNDDMLEETSDISVSKQTGLSYDIEISLLDLTNYYYEYGYRQGNVTYFGKTVKTSAEFNSSDSSWPKIVYFNIPSGGHYSASCNSFKDETFKKMSSKSRGETVVFVGKVDELLSSNNYKSGILILEDCKIIE